MIVKELDEITSACWGSTSNKEMSSETTEFESDEDQDSESSLQDLECEVFKQIMDKKMAYY